MKSAGLKETLVLPPLVGQLGRFLHLESAERGGALCSFSCSSVCSVFCGLRRDLFRCQGPGYEATSFGCVV